VSLALEGFLKVRMGSFRKNEANHAKTMEEGLIPVRLALLITNYTSNILGCTTVPKIKEKL